METQSSQKQIHKINFKNAIMTFFNHTYTTETKVHNIAFTLSICIFRRAESIPSSSEDPWLYLKAKLRETE